MDTFARAKHEPSLDASAAGDREGALTRQRILVIDDNEDIRDLLQVLLEASGHCVDVAGDGPSGVDRALATRPDVIFVDIGLPGMSGYDVARSLRATLGGEVFLAALTGYGQAGDRQRAIEAGFDAHLTKPVNFEDVEELLAGPSPS